MYVSLKGFRWVQLNINRRPPVKLRNTWTSNASLRYHHRHKYQRPKYDWMQMNFYILFIHRRGTGHQFECEWIESFWILFIIAVVLLYFSWYNHSSLLKDFCKLLIRVGCFSEKFPFVSASKRFCKTLTNNIINSFIQLISV